MLPTICAMCPQKIITCVKVPLKCNFANKSALFPQAAPCPFSILGRTLACTQSVDNLFHTLMVLWENEYFLTSNLLFLHQRVVMSSSSYFTFLNFQKNIRINIFITILFGSPLIVAFVVLSVHIPLIVLHI